MAVVQESEVLAALHKEIATIDAPFVDDVNAMGKNGVRVALAMSHPTDQEVLDTNVKLMAEALREALESRQPDGVRVTVDKNSGDYVMNAQMWEAEAPRALL